jgi:hypothetical protein
VIGTIYASKYSLNLKFNILPMKKINLLFRISVFAVLLGTFVSCSGSSPERGGDKSAKDAMSAFMAENDDIVAFGSTNLIDILNKLDYKSVPKLGKLLGTEVPVLEKLIDLASPMYYAVEGPLKKEDGTPDATYFFIQLKDADGLVDKLTENGFDFDEDKSANIRTAMDGDVGIGIQGKLGVIVAKSKKYEADELMAEVFEKITGEASGGKVDEILSAKGDIVIGMNLEAIYSSANSEFKELSKEDRKRIKSMVDDSYFQTVMKFEAGAGIIETKHYFSKKMQEMMFFKTDRKATILSKLGSGSPRYGFAVNLDMKKMANFLDKYAPGSVEEMAGLMGPEAQLGLMAAQGDLGVLTNGQLGILVFMDTELDDLEPQFSGYVGLGDVGKTIGKTALESFSFLMPDLNASIDNDGFSAYTDESNAPSVGTLSLPEGCENFGKSGVSAFFNLKGMDFDKLDLDESMNALRAVEYITADFDSDGGRIYIKAIDSKENILKQVRDVMIEDLVKKIEKLGF